MAKSKLDWFKLDCQLDDKLELIESEFGLVGFAVVVKLWQKIYGSEGYYCEWNDDVALVFARKINAGANVVSEIVARCLTRGIFDMGMYKKSGILTSHGIQSRYYECAARRKGEKIKPEYLLLCNTQNSDNADNSSKNVYISGKNADISDTEKKRVEKSRVDKSRKTDRRVFSAVVLSEDERAELVRLSDSLSVERYIKKLSEWQVKNKKISKKAYILIKQWLTEDKNSRKSEHSYDLDEFEEFAKDFDLSRMGENK
jgi:hypothetical protein